MLLFVVANKINVTEQTQECKLNCTHTTNSLHCIVVSIYQLTLHINGDGCIHSHLCTRSSTSTHIQTTLVMIDSRHCQIKRRGDRLWWTEATIRTCPPVLITNSVSRVTDTCQCCAVPFSNDQLISIRSDGGRVEYCAMEGKQLKH